MAKKRAAVPQPQSQSSRQSYDVGPEEFIRAWQSADNADEVATKLNMPKPIVLARASTYRQQGIHLKKMKRGSRRALDVDALNQIIEQMEREREREKDAKKK